MRIAPPAMTGSSSKRRRRCFRWRRHRFYAVEVRAAIIGVTGCGLDIDIECRVLDAHGRAIGGLFAAGEVLGVLQGRRYAGGGLSIGPAVILGRRAGQVAAAEAAALSLSAAA